MRLEHAKSRPGLSEERSFDPDKDFFREKRTKQRRTITEVAKTVEEQHMLFYPDVDKFFSTSKVYHLCPRLGTPGHTDRGSCRLTLRPCQRFSVTPPLPPGLRFDESTGVINGMPQAPMKSCSYEVISEIREDEWSSAHAEASQPRTFKCHLEFAVESPPQGLSYPDAECIVELSGAIAPIQGPDESSISDRAKNPNRMPASLSIAPSLLGGTVDAFTVEPPLPQGMMLDAKTGLIKGCPIITSGRGAFGAVNREGIFVVQAENSVGSCSCTVSMQFSSGAWDLMFVQFTQVQDPGLVDLGLSLQTSPGDEDMQWGNFHTRWNHDVLDRIRSSITTSQPATKVREDFTALQGMWKHRICEDKQLKNQRAKLMASWGFERFNARENIQ